MSLFSLPSIKAANEVNHCLIKGSRKDRLQTQNKPRYFKCKSKAHIYVSACSAACSCMISFSPC